MEKAEAEEAEKEEIMPLRVAEKDGYLHAVNRCFDCPFVIDYGADVLKVVVKKMRLRCGYDDITEENHIWGLSIPVWCPLPRGENGSGIITEEKFHSLLDEVINYIKDPEKTAVVERPIVFIVDDPGPPGFIAKEIVIKPEYPTFPDYNYLRKDDCLSLHRMATKGSEVLRENYWLCGTPTSSTIRITQGADLKKGDRLTVVFGATRRER